MSTEYPHVDTIWKRDMSNNKGRIIEGSFSTPALEYLFKNDWIGTEKIDGTNIRVFWDGVRAEFSGRTDNAQMPSTLVKKLDQVFRDPEMEERLRTQFPDADPGEHLVVLYGEGYGAGIQKAGKSYIPNGVDFILFDCKVGPWWMTIEALTDIGCKLDIRQVPILFIGSLWDACNHVRDGVFSLVSPIQFQAEGLVLRPAVELTDRRGHRIITKIKRSDYK